MTFKLPEIAQEPTPEGKRSIRRNIYGNLNGYVSGRFWLTFGEAYDPNAEADAEAWLNGFPIEEDEA